MSSDFPIEKKENHTRSSFLEAILDKKLIAVARSFEETLENRGMDQVENIFKNCTRIVGIE